MIKISFSSYQLYHRKFSSWLLWSRLDIEQSLLYSHARISLICFFSSIPTLSTRIVNVHRSFDNEINKSTTIGYARGWAWQHVLLRKKMANFRQEYIKCQSGNMEKVIRYDINDILLALESDHVYTLGRGSDEKNINFLSKKYSNFTVLKDKLSKMAEGPDSARLQIESPLQPDLKKKNDMMLEVESLDRPSPVFSPDGIPIYRTERGGEVTYHGPGQLVIYPLLDLCQPPYKKDLHWYLHCIEEVIIRTLREYKIVGVRDEINTGE